MVDHGLQEKAKIEKKTPDLPSRDKTSLLNPTELSAEISDAASVGDPSAPAGSPEINPTEKLKKKSRRARKEKKRQQRLLEKREVEAEVEEPEPEVETEEVVEVPQEVEPPKEIKRPREEVVIRKGFYTFSRPRAPRRVPKAVVALVQTDSDKEEEREGGKSRQRTNKGVCIEANRYRLFSVPELRAVLRVVDPGWAEQRGRSYFRAEWNPRVRVIYYQDE